MSKSCCEPSGNNSNLQGIDQTIAVEARYGSAANQKEACLCSPVSFDKKLLEIIPNNVIERDYGCGDPTRWVKPGDKVLDLGSGSGKNAFICAQIVGKSGKGKNNFRTLNCFDDKWNFINYYNNFCYCFWI